ncbi:anti-sigma factor [Parasphingorhabdus sp.]|uniref:anti-sigma factor n=1 Tax=Parasphingorhabdus sp. TaxID=2709688 RepID=UPI003001131E
MVDSPTEPEKRELLAAELALGLLEGEERAAAIRLRLSDPHFRDDVETWEDRLAPLLDLFPHESPRDQVWDSISAQIDRLGAAGTGDVVTGVSVRTRLQRWRVAALATGTIAASLALALLIRPAPVEVIDIPAQQVAPAQIIAQLSGEQDLAIATRFDPETGRLNVSTAGIAPDSGAPVLWVVPADGTPRALGILPSDGAGAIEIATEYRQFMTTGALLALTMEDPQAAPFEAPTTPILATGTISRI